MPTIDCSTACTVAVTLSLAPPTLEEVQDLGAAFGLIMVATAVIYGCRQLLNMLKADNDS